MPDQIWSVDENRWIDMAERSQFNADCAAYWYDTEYRRFLTGQRMKGIAAPQAIEALRQELGAMTRQEKRAAWEAKQEAWRKAREAKKRIPRVQAFGRPRLDLSVAEAKAAIAAAFFKTLANLEKRSMPAETRELLDGMKKQLAAW